MAKTERQIRAHNSGLQNIRCLGSYRLNDFCSAPAETSW